MRLAKGDYGAAVELSVEAIELSRAVGDEINRSVTLLNLAYALLELGRADEGRTALREAVELAHSLDFKEQLVYGLEALAAFALERGEPGACVRLLGAAETLRQSIGILLGRYEFAMHERTAEAAQSALGEAVFAAEWNQGSSLELDEAVAYGLECLAGESRVGDVEEPEASLG